MPSVGPTGQEVAEGHREGMRVETPEAPSVRLLWREKATEAVLAFLRDARVGCMVALRQGSSMTGYAGPGQHRDICKKQYRSRFGNSSAAAMALRATCSMIEIKDNKH